jgi:hypothetical protein
VSRIASRRRAPVRSALARLDLDRGEHTDPVENALVPSAWFSACADEATSVAFEDAASVLERSERRQQDRRDT